MNTKRHAPTIWRAFFLSEIINAVTGRISITAFSLVRVGVGFWPTEKPHPAKMADAFSLALKRAEMVMPLLRQGETLECGYPPKNLFPIPAIQRHVRREKPVLEIPLAKCGGKSYYVIGPFGLVRQEAVKGCCS